MQSDACPPEAHASQWGGTLEHWVAQGRPRSPPRPRGQRTGATNGRPEQHTDRACGGRDRRREGVPGEGRGAHNPRAGETTRRLLGRDGRRCPRPGRERASRKAVRAPDWRRAGKGFTRKPRREADLHGPKAEGGGRPRSRFTRRGPRRPLRRSRNLEGRAGCGDEEVHGDPGPCKKRGCETLV